MTVTTTKVFIEYIGNGATTSFNWDFLIQQETELIVTTVVIATGIGTVIPPSLFTATGFGNEAGGNVTYPLSGPALPATEKIRLERFVTLTQETSILNQDGFFPEVVEDSLDRIVTQIQQINEQTLPIATLEALVAQADSSATAAGVSETNAATSETNATTSETNAATSETNAATSETNAQTAETNAETAETNAETAETNAAASAQLAANYIGLAYTFSTTTTDADPGAGILRFNNATPASVTEIYIDNVDGSGADVSAWLDTWDDATSADASTLTVRSADDTTKFSVFSITAVADSTGYRTLSVTPLSTTALFSDAANLAIGNTRTGDLPTAGLAIGDFHVLVDAGGGTPGLPAVSGALLTNLPAGGGPNLGALAIIRINATNIQENIDVWDLNTVVTADTGADTLSVGTGAENDLYANGNTVQIETTGTAPAGLAIETTYFVVGVTTSTLQLALTFGGSAINITSTGTGTHTLYKLANGSTVGPVTIESGSTVTVKSGCTWSIF